MLKKLLALVAVISVALSVAAFAACEKKDHIYKEDGDDNNTVITPDDELTPDDGEQENPDDQTPNDGEQEDTDEEEENKVPSVDLPIIW